MKIRSRQGQYNDSSSDNCLKCVNVLCLQFHTPSLGTVNYFPIPTPWNWAIRSYITVSKVIKSISQRYIIMSNKKARTLFFLTENYKFLYSSKLCLITSLQCPDICNFYFLFTTAMRNVIVWHNYTLRSQVDSHQTSR